MIADGTQQFRSHLRWAGFPEVLCPRGVSDLAWDPESGRFRIRLDHRVTVGLPAGMVAFEVDVSGILVPQRLCALQGVGLVDPRGRRRIAEVRVDERRTTLTFALDGETASLPFELFV